MTQEGAWGRAHGARGVQRRGEPERTEQLRETERANPDRAAGGAGVDGEEGAAGRPEQVVRTGGAEWVRGG